MQELEGEYVVSILVFDSIERVCSLYDGGFSVRRGVLCTGVVRYDLSYLCSLSLHAQKGYKNTVSHQHCHRLQSVELILAYWMANRTSMPLLVPLKGFVYLFQC